MRTPISRKQHGVADYTYVLVVSLLSRPEEMRAGR